MQKTNAKWLGVFITVMGLAACDQQPSNQQPSISSTPAQATQPADHVAEGADLVAAASADARAINTSCPISGEKIDPQGQKMTYKGQIYGFCCDDCLDAFKANPAKYAVAQ